MNVDLGNARIRKPEPKDVVALYAQKNDPEIAAMLCGFTTGYTRADIEHWIKTHTRTADEAVFIIADEQDDCLGHVGLYQIDHRIRSASFGIMVGDSNCWGKGIGRTVTRWTMRYGFADLALHRIHLDVMEENQRALKLYESLGFRREGLHRHAQWKGGVWRNIISMSLLEDEWNP